MAFYIGLLHYPVYNRKREIIISAITNLDIHDLARLGETYGAEGIYLINPLKEQQELARRICRHWVKGYGAQYNINRKEAMSLVSVVPTLDAAVAEIKSNKGEAPILIATDAGKNNGGRINYPLAMEIVKSKRVVMILFGTAWGIAKEFMSNADYLLEPILGVSDYNHLSVRTAAAITLDRLFSPSAAPYQKDT